MASEVSRYCLPKLPPVTPNTLVALAAFWVNFCLLGVLRSNAVIYRALVDEFQVNREDAAWPSGIFGFCMCVTGALSGFLSRLVSIRTLALFGAALASVSVSTCSFVSEMRHIVYLYGALQGIGIGLIVPLTHVIINQNFTKYIALALGIAYSGSSAGSFLFPPVANALLSSYGLDGTFLLLGGIMLNSLIGAMLFKPPRLKKHNSPSDSELVDEGLSQSENSFKKNNPKFFQQIEENKSNTKECINALSVPDVKSEQIEHQKLKLKKGFLCSELCSSFKLAAEILSSPYFLIIAVTYAVYFSNSSIYLMVVMDFAKDRGVPLNEGVYLVSAFSFGDFAGRLSFGWIADTQCMRRNVLVHLYLLTMGIITALLPVFPTSTLSTVSVLLGVLNGSVIVNHSVLLNEYLGLDKLPLAIGFSTCFVGITAFLRPLVIGLFRDRYEAYDYLFTSIGILQISITVLWFAGTFVQFIRRRILTKRVIP